MVIAVDVTGDKLEVAQTFGATQTVNAREVDDVVGAVRDLTGGGVDYSFEAIGSKATAEQAFRLTSGAARRRSSGWSRATSRWRSAAWNC